MEVLNRPAKSTSQGGANLHDSEKDLEQAKTSFFASDVCAGLGGVGRFKLKIVKKSPTAEQLVNGENVPNKMALAEGYGQAWDIWSEEKDMNRRMW